MNNELKKIASFVYFFPGTVLGKTKFLFHKVTYGRRLEVVGSFFVRNKGKITIGERVRIRSGLKTNPIGCGTKTCIITTKDGSIQIGNHVKMSNVAIVCQKSIVIDDEVMIGGGVKIWDTDFHSINPYIRMEIINTKEIPLKEGIHIKAKAFIGAGSYILKGVTVGENSIVAAGSVLTHDVPDNQIWGGNPAHFLRNLTEDELMNDLP